MTGLLLDLRLAFRGLARRRWAAAGVALSLGLGFATQIVVLSAVSAVLWKPLAIPRPEQIATIYGYSRLVGGLTNIAYPHLMELRSSGQFEELAAFTRFQLIWESEQASEKLNAEMVSENYFEMVGPRFARGNPPRELGEIAISEEYWRSRLGSSPEAIGQTLRLSGEPYVITGVVSREFRGTLLDYIGNPKLWLTLRSQSKLPFLRNRDLRQDWVMNWFVGVGRLKAGVTAAQAQNAVAALDRHLRKPAGATPREARVIAASRANFHPSSQDRVQRTLLVCMALSALLLLLGCLSVSFFLLGKTISERPQISVERALGAGGMRVGRRRLLEAAILCGVALIAGTGLARWGVALLENYPPPLAAILFLPAWDWRVWTITTGWTMIAILATGFAPALLAMRSRLTPAQSVYSGPSRSARRLRESMVALQLAVACAILAASGFVLRTVASARSMELGFDTNGLVMAEVELYGLGAGAGKRSEVLHGVLAGLREQPSVIAASASSLMPLTIFRMPRRVRDSAGSSIPVYFNAVSDNYFSTLQLPLRRGRTFQASPSARETVVNETLARILDPVHGDVVGRTLEVAGEDEEHRPRLAIVGVAQDARYHTLWQDRIPYYYVSIDAEPGGEPAIIVRSRAGTAAAWQLIREAVRGVLPQSVVAAPRTGSSQVAALIQEQAYLAAFSAALALIAIVIAATGLMANLYLMVSQRTREIGIRQALGASRAMVTKLVLVRGMALAAGGLAMGLLAGSQLQRWIGPLAPGTEAGDPLPAALSIFVLLLVAFGATLGPAIRATRIEPWTALKHTE